MKKIKTFVLKIPFSISIYRALKKSTALPYFISDFVRFRRLSGKGRFSVYFHDIFPCLLDRTTNTSFEPHYTYHLAWAARKVAESRPDFHIDISSSLSFATIVSAFVPVRFYDYRPAKLNLGNLSSERGDLMQLPFADNSVTSLSCMHTIEHVGLGRYGDPIDPDGDLKAIKELKRVLAPGGSLLFVVPIGKPKIQFNAHRIYSYGMVKEYFSDLELKEFSLIPDEFKEKGMIYSATKKDADAQKWGCGCFLFVKK